MPSPTPIPPVTTPLRLDVDAAHTVSVLATEGAAPRVALTLAHGAGAPMTHPFLHALAEALARHGVAVLRFNFPAAEAGARRVDTPARAHATVRAAVDLAARRWPTLPRFAGGKSFGVRMTTQAQALAPLAGVRGIVAFGFPLHAAGAPSTARADHLDDVHVPLCLLQGTRDALADAAAMAAVVARLRRAAGADVTWTEVDDADHGFHVRRASGRDDAQVIDALAADAAGWMLAQR